MFALAISLITLVTAVVVLLQNRGQKSQINDQAKQLTEVHILVNQKFTDAVARIDQLSEIIKEANIALPPAPVAPVSTPIIMSTEAEKTHIDNVEKA